VPRTGGSRREGIRSDRVEVVFLSKKGDRHRDFPEFETLLRKQSRVARGRGGEGERRPAEGSAKLILGKEASRNPPVGGGRLPTAGLLSSHKSEQRPERSRSEVLFSAVRGDRNGEEKTPRSRSRLTRKNRKKESS